MSQRMKRMGRAALLGLFALALAAAAQADQGTGESAEIMLDTVLVTAEKTTQEAQEIPASVSVVTGEQLDEYGVVDSPELFRMVPNLFLVQMGPKAGPTGFASMRGITSYMAGSPVLGFYVDDVYYTNLEMNLYDIERAEVLRGPQGTLYGRNSEAGVINIVTRKPGNEWSGTTRAGYGSYGSREVSTSLGGPLVEDTLKVRLAGRYAASEGYNTNRADGDDEIGGPEDMDARLTFDWAPSDDWSVQWTSDVQNYRSPYADFTQLANLEDDPHEVDVDYEGAAEREAYGTSIRAEHAMDGMRLVSITAARSERNTADNDVDFSPVDFMRLGTETKADLLSEELRLVSDTGGPAKWLTGIYLFNETSLLSADMDIRPLSATFSQEGTTETLGSAVFGQYSYTFFDRLTFTGGLRYDREQKDFDYTWRGGSVWGLLGGTAVPDQDGTASKTFNAWLPKFVVDYRWADGLNTYASVSRGFKSGGFNVKDSPGEAFDAEYTWNYEAGVKSRWLNNRLQANLALFHISWENQQVEVPNYPDFTVINAESSTSQGLELELRALPRSDLEFTGSFGMVYSTLDDMEYSGADYSGSRAPNVPGYTASLGATYRFLDGWALSLLYNRVGERYLDLDNSRKQDAYQTVDARLSYAADGFEVSLWTKNLFDEGYATRAFESSGVWYARAGDPRTFGISLAYTF